MRIVYENKGGNHYVCFQTNNKQINFESCSEKDYCSLYSFLHRHFHPSKVVVMPMKLCLCFTNVRYPSEGYYTDTEAYVHLGSEAEAKEMVELCNRCVINEGVSGGPA